MLNHRHVDAQKFGRLILSAESKNDLGEAAQKCYAEGP